MNNQEIEQEIQDKGLTAPRVTPEMIEAAIEEEMFLYPEIGKATLTICVLLLANGFTVTGESACVDPLNYNKELGNTIARDNAKNKIWALEGYLLQSNAEGPA